MDIAPLFDVTVEQFRIVLNFPVLTLRQAICNSQCAWSIEYIDQYELLLSTLRAGVRWDYLLLWLCPSQAVLHVDGCVNLSRNTSVLSVLQVYNAHNMSVA